MPSRRELLLAGAGSALAAVGCNALSTGPQEPPRVSIVRAQAYDGALYDIVRRTLVQQQLDPRGKHVVLKPNLVEFDPSTPINTHPVFVHAAREAFLSLGAASVRIAEGPGHRRDAFDLADAAGYFGAIPGFEDLFRDLNLEEVERVTLQRPHSRLKELYLPKLLLGADLIVSLAKMKTHHWVGATLTMKNFFGTVPGGIYGWPKNVLHWSGINECIADLHNVYPRTFGLVDGIECMEGNGPIQGTPRHAGVVVAGRSLPAVDATCARIMGIDPAKFAYLNMATRRGELDAAHIQQIGEPIASVHTDFELYGEFKAWRL
ncbi:MAG: DUF362 domain-containing protein [Bryobacterales bacterium]|nr:DUF362 domain-containing protein [Bryobacterales bacterium]